MCSAVRPSKFRVPKLLKDFKDDEIDMVERRVHVC